MPLMAFAQDNDKTEKEEKRAQKRAAKIERQLERQGQRPRGEGRGERRSEDVQPAPDAQPTAEAQPVAAPQSRTETQGPTSPRYTPEVQPQVAPQVNTETNTQVQRREFPARTFERRGPRNHSWSYDEARRYHRRDRRDRSWWRSNYSRFALFGGGYYYWDRGYWYPAYGYDPRYSRYTYDEPIYGYNQMEPGRVLVNVQRALRRQGYYRGAIDGLIGPQTRAALARFQRDAGLYVTRRIDGPTLAALGLV